MNNYRNRNKGRFKEMCEAKPGLILEQDYRSYYIENEFCFFEEKLAAMMPGE